MRFISTDETVVELLKKRAKALQRKGAGKHTELLDRVARGAGYDHWHHVTLCARKTLEGQLAAKVPYEVSTYDAIATKALQVREIFARRNISLHPQSVLADFFEKARALSEAHAARPDEGHGIDQLLAMMHTNRIADPIIGVADEAFAQELLRRIAKKDMNLGENTPSQGKDALFELELLAFFRRNGARAQLQEPDIVVSLGGIDYPIACKKINSEGNAVGQVRSACKQLRGFGSKGIVALNIDALVPENSFLRGPSINHTGKMLQKMSEDFLDRHIFKLQDAISNEKCDAIIFSISSPIDVSSAKPRFSLQNETMFWSVSNRNPGAKERLTHLGKILKAPQTIHRG